MKIALLADYYPAYLKAFYREHSLAPLGFAEHQTALFGGYFGSFVSYRNWLRHIGHDAELIVGNDHRLQQKWLDEHGERLQARPSNKHQAVLRRIAAVRPDVLFVGSMFDYFGRFFREVAPHVGAIVTWIACPHPGNLDFTHVRCVVSSVEAFVEEFRARGLRAERLAAAFDEEVLARLGPVADDVPLSFVGALGGPAHRFRVRSLRQALAAGLPLQLWGYALPRKLPLWPSPLHRAYRGEAWGLEMYRVLARSRLTVNLHGDIAKVTDFGGNMRVYEATGCGALLVTDTARNLESLFRPGEEVVTFASQGELREKVRYYLGHPAEAQAIARRGQAACLARHGYRTRIREFERILVEAAP